MEAHLFQFGVWQVNPLDNSITHGLEKRQMEPRAMDVLVVLCKASGTILSAEQLLEQCWGSTLYGDNPVHKTIAQLRKLLGDQSKAPVYIETIRKRGYRTIAVVEYPTALLQPVNSWLKESPFRGLQSFDEQHAPVFFGRSDPVFRLTQQITQQCQTSQHSNSVALFLILGASGSGKSSLVRAGLIPHLRQVGAELQLVSWVSFDMAEKGAHSCMTSLAAMLLDLEVADQRVFDGQSVLSLRAMLSNDMAQVSTILRASMAHLPASVIYRHALFLDRFEAVFDDNTVSESERAQFLQVLDTLARSNVLIILLACRNDFYPRIVAQPVLMEAKSRGCHFDVLPPTPAEIAQIIRLPALAANLTFGVDEQSQVGLDDILCQCTIGNPDALPLLQYTLQELYTLRSPDQQLTFAAFHQLGGIDGAIGHRAEQITLSLSDAQRACLPQIFSLVTTISTHDSIVTGRRAGWGELVSDDEREVVTALVESRLLVSEMGTEIAGFSVAHEALLRRWPRMVDWIENHRHALQIRGRVSELATRWSNDANNPDLLLAQGKPLDEASSLLSIAGLSLSGQDRALITASQNKAALRQRIRRIVIWSTSLLGVLVVWLAFSAFSARRQATERPIAVERLMSVMLSDAHDKTDTLGQLEFTDSARVEALNFFVKSDEYNLSAAEIAQRPKTLIALAEVSSKRNDIKSAQAAWQAASLILNKELTLQSQGSPSRDLLKMSAEVAFNQAKIALKENAFLDANRFLQQARKYATQLEAKDPGNVAVLILLAEIHRQLGNLEVQFGKLGLAEIDYLQVVALTNRVLTAKADDVTVNEGLADAWFRLGTVKKAQGAFVAAMDLHQQEADLEQRLLARHPQNDNLAYRLARAIHEQAELSLALGRDQAALRLLGQAEQLYVRILRYDPSDHHWLSAIINTRILRQDILARAAALHQSKPMQQLSALREIEAAIREQSQIKSKGLITEKRIWTRLEAQLSTSIVRATLALSAEKKNSAVIKPMLALANQKLVETELALAPLLQVSPIDMGDMIVLVDAILTQADFESSQKAHIAAQKTCQRGADLLTNKIVGSADYVLLVPWLRLQICLGNAQEVDRTRLLLEKIDYHDREYLRIISNL